MSADKTKPRPGRRLPKSPEPSGGGGGRGHRTQEATKPEPPANGEFSPALLFVVLAFVAAGGGAFAVAGTSPVNVVFVGLGIATAGVAAFLLYRTVWPLVGPLTVQGPDMLGGRTRAALEREKAAVLRAIKELEFDRAMGKVSDSDFQDMSARLRARAVGLIKQLDTGAAGYRELIERELVARRAAGGTQVGPQSIATAPAVAGPIEPSSASVGRSPGACGSCGTLNDADAQFCKQCGNKLLGSS